MYREIFKKLEEWKDKKNKKPLIIEGARQVGKTWLMKEFGKKIYKNDVVYINFDKNREFDNLFGDNLEPQKIINRLSLILNKKITEQTLILFDEVQECSRALTSLKYFSEETNYQIICAGSFLGIALHKGTSFPVGKVEFLNLYPMNFNEFLIANGEEKMVKVIELQDFELIKIFKKDFEEYLKLYFYIGGMPAVVQNYIENKNLQKVKEIQETILESYENDFSKHTDKNVFPRMLDLWHSIPSQLAKENKKFLYKNIKEGARAREYEVAMLWLSDCGLITKVENITKAIPPIISYINPSSFKLFFVDIGLLSAMLSLDYSTIFNGIDVLQEYKGALTEQFVLQELRCLNDKSNREILINYWSKERGMAEVDFVIQKNNHIIPIEVKATINLQAKSLRTYNEAFKPEIMIRTSMADYKKTDNLVDIPLYVLRQFIKNL